MKTDKKSIYIIGNIPTIFNDDTIEKFKNAELDMMSKGFRVYNPLSEVNHEVRGLNNVLKIKNIKNLFKSDAIYLLPCAEINQNNLKNQIIKTLLISLMCLLKCIVKTEQPSYVEFDSLLKTIKFYNEIFSIKI